MITAVFFYTNVFLNTNLTLTNFYNCYAIISIKKIFVRFVRFVFKNIIIRVQKKISFVFKASPSSLLPCSRS